MATAQQLRAAASEVPAQGSHLPSYYNPSAVNANKIMDQARHTSNHFIIIISTNLRARHCVRVIGRYYLLKKFELM